jgi:hypothetical protein
MIHLRVSRSLRSFTGYCTHIHYKELPPWIEKQVKKPVGFGKNQRNRPGLVSSIFDKLASESIFFK